MWLMWMPASQLNAALCVDINLMSTNLNLLSSILFLMSSCARSINRLWSSTSFHVPVGFTANCVVTNLRQEGHPVCKKNFAQRS